ncbi:Outer membrane protein assembly factor BamB, contains PQQ-like beta-propeller repeat [Frankineae bacterium MT45]|nr:Outer membrane protein assembly factor BamB, contains PQQ-like beta-propeller repeat [Frankineae bacterium MT45]
MHLHPGGIIDMSLINARRRLVGGLSSVALATVAVAGLTASAASASSVSPSVDSQVSGDSTTAIKSVTTAHQLVSSSPGELIVAFVSADGPKNATQHVTSVVGAGLAWSLAVRSNATWGTTEVWTSYATVPVTAKITAKLALPYDASITVVAYKNAAPVVGATAANGSRSGHPSVTITPKSANSILAASAHDWTADAKPVSASGQSLIHVFRDHRVHDAFWVQTASGSAAGTPVAIADRAPVGDRWSMGAVEIQPATPASQAIAFQGSAVHDGNSGDSSLAPPLTRGWSVPLPGSGMSYPIIAGGRAFVASAGPQAGSYLTSMLTAYDLHTGAIVWGPVTLSSALYWIDSLTFGDGKVYALDSSGLLQAFDATSGRALWSSQMPGQYFFTAAPTAYGGSVYVSGAGSGGTVYAVDGSTGTVEWTAQVMNGDDSSPAVTDGAVYVSYACNQAYAFNRADGRLLWHYSGACEGGGGATVAVHDGRVYTRDYFGDLILDANTGADLGSYSSDVVPAFSGDTALYISSNVLHAVNAAGTTVWSFAADPLSAPPVIDNGIAYVSGQSGKVYGLRVSDGALVWSADAGGTTSGGDGSSGGSGLAAAEGYLLVPTATSLVAFHNSN